MTQITHFLVVKVSNLRSSDRVKNALGFSASSWLLSSSSNLARTAELPAWEQTCATIFSSVQSGEVVLVQSLVQN